MEPRYNIYFAGQLLPGHELESARARLAKLFNANEQLLDKLFSGKPQLLKKECDKSTAVKYQQAMERAGAKAVIKAAADAPPQATASSAPTPPPATQSMTAAERIAALAAAPDAGTYETAEPPAAPGQDTATPGDDNVALAPVGTDVLRPEERSAPVAAHVDTAGLDLDSCAQRLSEPPPPPPPAPDTSHLHMGEVGDDIPTLASQIEPLSPNTDSLQLSPEGTDFADCAAPVAEQPDLDLSALDLAAQGSDVLEQQYRKEELANAPPTDHISLED